VGVLRAEKGLTSDRTAVAQAENRLKVTANPDVTELSVRDAGRFGVDELLDRIQNRHELIGVAIWDTG
jgi:hypothetical protein